MADYGLKSTRSGKDITSTTVRDYTLHSQYNTLKIATEGYGTASVTTGVNWTLDVAHNLGYKPMIFFYYKHPNNNRWHLATSYADINTGATWALYGNVVHKNDNEVTLKLYDGLIDTMPSSPTNVNYKYIILIEPRLDTWYE